MSEVITPKVFKTHAEQLAILKERGLHVEDDDFALETLKKINYYRLTGYMLTLKKDNIFDETATFNKAVRIHDFDTKLRRLLLEATEYIEVTFRAQLAYEFSQKYGGLGYKKSENFFFEDQHQRFIEIIEKKISQSHELFVIHHRNKYENQLPLWAVIELFTMDVLSKFYQNMRNEDKKEIAKKFYGVSQAHLSNWLHALTIVRNTCAHYSRVYNKKFSFSIKLFKNVKINNERLISVIYIIKRLLPETEWKRFINYFDLLIDEYSDVIELHHLGFKDNWTSVLK
ncbi:Abi family protein [Bacillus subtilis]|uniref:Abi family protein n=1 Tax=Bacillus subtilis TaxID=1423 RepID=UPI00240D6EDD|nr:Abi family protein [Bacillus subtilis]WFA91176.1 Abi family protein [Bacillus subtilis]